MKSHMKVSAVAAEALKAKHAVRSNPDRFRHLLPNESFKGLNVM